jgi:hypothetical protein
MSEGHIGAEVMVDVALNAVDSMFPSISDEDKDQAATIFRDFATKKANFEDASRRIIKLLGKNDPLVKIKNIIELPQTPLPFNESELQDDGSEKGFFTTGSTTPTGNIRKKTRTWSVMEDNRLLAGVYHYGTENWKSVCQFLGSGRNRAQCSQRWTRCLNPRISKKNWSEEENRQLEELVRLNGDKSWTKISALMGNRSDVQCRYHYRQLKNEAAGIGLSDSSGIAQSSTTFNLKADVLPQSPSRGKDADRQATDGEDEQITLGETRKKSKYIASSSPNMFRMESIFEITKKPLFPRFFGVVGGSPADLDDFLSNFK